MLYVTLTAALEADLRLSDNHRCFRYTFCISCLSSIDRYGLMHGDGMIDGF